MAALCSRHEHRSGRNQASGRKWALTFLYATVAATLAANSGCATAVGSLSTLDIVRRSDGQVLPVYPKDGRNWVVGTPGREYSVRVCNTTAGRMLAVMSVDGVNVITGDTAAPAQSGYVLSAYECADISGWRKSMSRTAAFYFTELPDAYAARTGRPENVGVIGVALWPEKQPPIPMANAYGKLQAEKRADAPASAPAPATARQEAASGGAAADRHAQPSGPEESDKAAATAQAPLAKLGTGHGRSEHSPTQMVAFERASTSPAETIAIHYDRRENLVAMGVLPPPTVARLPNPFPATPPRFVPNPR